MFPPQGLPQPQTLQVGVAQAGGGGVSPTAALAVSTLASSTTSININR